jgi:DNA polymerase I-like protein with 3'-5' exonuclease and polymerase domains
VQGTGADVMMLARLSAHRRISDAGIPCDFVSTVHDSIVVDCREKYLEDIKNIFDGVFRDIPDNIYRLFGYKWNVPMACESKYGPNMLDMRKFS